MAIPFFMLAGELMIKAGIVERLIALANSVVGRVQGGLAHVTMLAGAGLATVSGAAASDASALSTMESNAAYIMLVPLLHPIALQYGLDPLHFGFLFVLNLVIGMLTPPVGVVLFVVCGVTRVPMSELVKSLWPFIALMYAVLLLCLFYPPVVTWLPHKFGY